MPGIMSLLRLGKLPQSFIPTVGMSGSNVAFVLYQPHKESLMGTPHSDVTTTNGDVFTIVEHVDLARLILKRFGYDLTAATEAWCRLLQNDTQPSDFAELVGYPEHTAYCEGQCLCPDPEEYDGRGADRAMGRR